MAYASWVSPSETSGSGNDTVSWTGQEHTGFVSGWSWANSQKLLTS